MLKFDYKKGNLVIQHNFEKIDCNYRLMKKVKDAIMNNEIITISIYRDELKEDTIAFYPPSQPTVKYWEINVIREFLNEPILFYRFYCDKMFITELIEEFITDPGVFMDLPGFWKELLDYADKFATHSCYRFFDLNSIFTEDPSGEIIVFVWDDNLDAIHYIFREHRLTEEEKEKLREKYPYVDETEYLSDFLDRYEEVNPSWNF